MTGERTLLFAGMLMIIFPFLLFAGANSGSTGGATGKWESTLEGILPELQHHSTHKQNAIYKNFHEL